MAGATYDLIERDGVRKLFESMHFKHRRLSAIGPQHQKTIEWRMRVHCVLARTDLFDKIGLFDEEMLSTREHIDFCLLVKAAGGTIWCEPASVIAYVPTDNLEDSDVEYYKFRWSEPNKVSTLAHFEKKWNVKLHAYHYGIAKGSWKEPSRPSKSVCRRCKRFLRALHRGAYQCQ